MQSWASFATCTWVSQGKEAAPLSHPWIYPRPLKTELPVCGAQGRKEEHQQLRTTSVGVSIPPSQSAWPLDWKPVGDDLGLESSYTMSWVNFSVSWIEFGSVQLRAWHFLAVGMGTNKWSCRARGCRDSTRAPRGSQRHLPWGVPQCLLFSVRTAHHPKYP